MIEKTDFMEKTLENSKFRRMIGKEEIWKIEWKWSAETTSQLVGILTVLWVSAGENKGSCTGEGAQKYEIGG